MKKRLAGVLRRAANRIDPQPPYRTPWTTTATSGSNTTTTIFTLR